MSVARPTQWWWRRPGCEATNRAAKHAQKVEGERPACCRWHAVHAAVQELGAAFGVALAAVAISVFAGLDVLPAGAYSAAFVLLGVLMAVCVVGAARLPTAAGERALRTVPTTA